MTRSQTYNPKYTLNGIPTEPVGSVPRHPELLDAIDKYSNDLISLDEMNLHFDKAVQDVVEQFDATGSPVISDGEQAKSSFATYPLEGLDNISNDGITISFEDGHRRQLPRLEFGPFKYSKYAGSFIPRLKKITDKPIKQAVISASAMSLLYPKEGIHGYSKEQFLEDLILEAVKDIRSCFDNGAMHVQIDFTEARLAIKLDPTKELLQHFIDINNKVLSHFSESECQRIGVHTCPGADHDSTHSADIDYEELIPMLLTLNSGNFYMQMASESNPEKSLKIIADHLLPHQRVYVGVIDVVNEEVESVDEVVDRILMAAKYIPIEQLGTTDDCGFSPFSDDIATSRNTAFAKIATRVKATKLAYNLLN